MRQPAGIIPYDALHQPLSPLFLDYLAGRERAAAFLRPRGFELPAIAAAADRAQALDRPMAAVAEALARQQEARGAERGRRAGTGARRSREPPPSSPASRPDSSAGRSSSSGRRSRRSRCPGGSRRSGAGRWCRCSGWPRTTTTSRRSVRPRSSTPPGRSGRCATIPQQEPVGRPAWAIVLDDTWAGWSTSWRARCPPALGRDETVELARPCYRPGETLAVRLRAARLAPAARARRARSLATPTLKRLVIPVLARELARGLAHLAARPRGRTGPARGGLPPAGPGAPGLPEPVRDRRGPAARPRDSRATWSRCAARASAGPSTRRSRRLEREPRAWSPGALLRPLVQDALLPTAAYVGGPAEIAYHAQIGPVLRPLRDPAAGALAAAEPDARRAAPGAGARGRAADARRPRGRPRALVTRWAREAYPDVEAAFARTREAIERELGAVEDGARRARPDAARRRGGRPAAGRCTRSRACTRSRCARSRSATRAAAERLRRTRDALLPGGSLQERGLGLVGLVGRHGARDRAHARGAAPALRARAPGGVAVKLGIVCYPTVGGSGAVAAELGKQLARRGHEVHVISYRLPFRLGDFQQNVCFHEVDVSSYPLFEYPPHDLALAVKMAEVAREHGLRAVPRALRDPARDRRLPGPADARRRARRAW